MAAVLARRRREITTRREVFVDLLSWRFAQQQPHARRLLPPASALGPGVTRVQDSAAAAASVRGDAGDARLAFRRFVAAIDARISTEVLASTQRLCEQELSTYDPRFSLEHWDAAKDAPPFDEERKREDEEFLQGVVNLLSRSRYHLASSEEWKYARDHVYGFSVPVSVQWKAYDTSLLHVLTPRLYGDKRLSTAGDNAEGRVTMPMESKHALVLHRGVGVDRTTAFFFGEKTDELIRRSALWLYRFMLARVRSMSAYLSSNIARARDESMRRSASVLDAARAKGQEIAATVGSQLYTHPVMWLESKLREHISRLQSPLENFDLNVSISLPDRVRNVEFPGTMRQSTIANVPDPAPVPEGEVKPALAPAPIPEPSQYDSNRVVLTAKDTMLADALRARMPLAEHPLDPLSFFSRITLQEPTYKQVVVIYRMLEPELPSTLSVSQGIGYKKLGRDPTPRHPNRRNICIKHFRDVPMADLELLLPNRKVHLKVSDRLNYSIMGLIGGTALLNVVTSTDSGFLFNPAWIAAVIASGSYFGRVISRMYMSWSYYNTMTNSIYAENITAADPAAVAWIAREAEEQMSKELAVTVLALVELGEWSDFSRITEQAQDILHQKYSPEVHMFDPTEALSALERFGVLEVDRTDGQPVRYRLLSTETTDAPPPPAGKLTRRVD